MTCYRHNTSDYFESFTKTELDHPEDPEYPESPEDAENPDDPEGPEGPDDSEGPEPWWPIKEEHQEANGDLVRDVVISNC